MTRYTVGEHAVQMTDENTHITDGLFEEEMAGLRRAEQQIAEYATRRARELTDGTEHARAPAIASSRTLS